MAAIDRTDDSYSERGTAFWLPPTGYGNGLPSTAWAQIVDLPARLADPVLARLTAAGIPAHLDVRRENAQMPPRSAPLYHLWVDPHRYSAAEDLLMDVLRADHRRSAEGSGPLTPPGRRRAQ